MSIMNITYKISPLLITVCFWACNKPNNTTPPSSVAPQKGDTLTCSGCKENIISKAGASVYYNIPNSFTPNGDGKNDIFRMLHKGINNTAFNITILNSIQDTVATIKSPMNSWDGRDKNGNYLPAGDYPTRVYFTTINNDTIESSICVSIMQYNTSKCIPVNGKKYCFEDQLDHLGTISGIAYQTSENICP